MKPKQSLKEELANLCHEQWSRWMKYLFSKCQAKETHAEIPASLVNRWCRQIETEYKNLPEEEKESDRKEANKFIELFDKYSQSKSQIVEQILGMESMIGRFDKCVPMDSDDKVWMDARNQLRLEIKEELKKL